jgi:hypothetical protein
LNGSFRLLSLSVSLIVRERRWWSAEDLAKRTALSVTTIRRAELTDSETSLTNANDRAVRLALESAGVEFIDENGGGPGVRLRKRQQKKS